jgi:hypothetical protein
MGGTWKNNAAFNQDKDRKMSGLDHTKFLARQGQDQM